MLHTVVSAFAQNFLGGAPRWYKSTVLAFLLVNPIVLFLAGPFITGWVLVLQFIFTLAMALRCYPLQPGGLLALEAIVLGLATPQAVYHEVEANFAVILLLMFMVAGIYFLRDMLLWIFTKLLVRVRSKLLLSLLFSGTAAFLSAFLDALTVVAVVITVATGFYAVYHRIVSGRSSDESHDHTDDAFVHELSRQELDRFRAFLRSLMMHAAVGTALGGVCTLVGEPQNLLIGEVAGWTFMQFFVNTAPVSMPVLVVGLITCVVMERLAWFGYGQPLPESVHVILERHEKTVEAQRDAAMTARLIMQALTAVFLIVALALHVAAVGLIGLTIIILATAFTGVIEEKRLGHAFEEALPFTALLVTFFAVVAVIHQQHLFTPVIQAVLALEGRQQLAWMFIANGVLSMVSDNVFVATIYITEVKAALDAGLISREQFGLLAVSVNTGTNIPSVATPNGQAAFLFLLTSAVAPLIRLGYGRMLWMAVPYALTLSVTGLLCTIFLL
jgi:Na+:H+ antiporter, NhaB family